MAALKKIPKWGWVTGGIGLVLLGLLIYEHRKNSVLEDEKSLDPCDPENPQYDPEQCPPTDNSQYPAKQMVMPSGAAGGINYYLPLPGGSGAKGAEDALPEETGGEPESEIIAPAVPGVIVTPTPPGQPVPGSTSKEGLYGAIPAPAPGPFVTAPPVPSPTPPVAVAPAIPAPGGWCGHPNAVGLNRPCADKYKMSPPSGWHFLCCNGSLGRAPN